MDVKNQTLFEGRESILKTEPRPPGGTRRKGSHSSVTRIHKGSDISSSDDESGSRYTSTEALSKDDESKVKRRKSRSPSTAMTIPVSSEVSPTDKQSEAEILDKKVSSLRRVIQKDTRAADLSWSLFIAACNSYRFDSILKPFPPFYVKEENDKDIETLRSIAESAPALMIFYAHIQEIEKKFSNQLIELMHWVLVHSREPKLHYVAKDDHHEVLSLVPSKAKAATPNHIFKVAYSNKLSSEGRFQDMAKRYKTKFGYHGSKLENFYSIVHHGLQVALNKVGAFGPGIYLSSELSVCLPYSQTGFSWGKSVFGSEMSIVALCEMVDHPDVKCQNERGTRTSRSYAAGSENGPVPHKYFIVQNSDLVRVRYLLVYCTDRPPQVEEEPKQTIWGWINQHRLVSAFVGYFLFLFAMGLRNSPGVQRYMGRLFERE